MEKKPLSKERHVSCVFIAPTQHGKSTTIDKYHEVMCDRKPSGYFDGFVLGNGTTSASRIAIVLPKVKVHYLTFNEWPDQDAEVDATAVKAAFDKFNALDNRAKVPEDLAEELFNVRHEHMLAGGGKYTANVERGPVATLNPTGDQEEDLVLHCIDTPGLDDSEGKGADDEIITSVLDILVSKWSPPEVASFVFVVKYGMSWSGSFLASAKRYWDQFPTFRENWIFIHTGMDTFAEDFSGANCYEEACEKRKRELVSALTGIFDEQPGLVTSLPHIFLENIGTMDSKRKAYKKKAEFQAMERAKNFNKFTNFITACQLKEVQTLEYRKSADNEVLDAAMTQLFEQRKQGVQSALAPLKVANSKFVDKMLAASEEKQTLDHQVRDLKERLLKINNEKMLVKARKFVSEEWTWWGKKVGVYKLKVPFPSAGVKHVVIKNHGYPSGECTMVDFKWDKKEKATVWSVECSSQWCRGYEFDLKLLVQTKIVYHDEITKLLENLGVKNAELATINAAYEAMREENKSTSDEIEGFTKQIEFFAECAYLTNKKTVDLGKWKDLSVFYKWAQSPEGVAVFRDVNQSNTVLEKFCESHRLLDRYKMAIYKVNTTK